MQITKQYQYHTGTVLSEARPAVGSAMSARSPCRCIRFMLGRWLKPFHSKKGMWIIPISEIGQDTWFAAAVSSFSARDVSSFTSSTFSTLAFTSLFFLGGCSSSCRETKTPTSQKPHWTQVHKPNFSQNPSSSTGTSTCTSTISPKPVRPGNSGSAGSAAKSGTGLSPGTAAASGGSVSSESCRIKPLNAPAE